jgi:hypothetical protein
MGAIASFSPDSPSVISIVEPQTICMAGVLAPVGPSEPWAELVLGLDRRGTGTSGVPGTCILSVFDAPALGITALEFTLDRMPETRMFLNSGTIVKSDCGDPYECVLGGVYTLLSPDQQDVVLLEEGRAHVELSDFAASRAQAPYDPSRISFFSLRLVPTTRPTEFDFCVSEVRFLDAAGREVTPPN